jgi:uncharacterized phage infection (PIP) family protein YhgE
MDLNSLNGKKYDLIKLIDDNEELKAKLKKFQEQNKNQAAIIEQDVQLLNKLKEENDKLKGTDYVLDLAESNKYLQEENRYLKRKLDCILSQAQLIVKNAEKALDK